MVILPVWEWWFVTFDMPLLHDDTPHTAARTAASLLSPPPPPSTLHPCALCDPALLLFAHVWTPPS